ncbi:hypothetical protein Gorai_019500, partial [Gossypium raimondii]|nr:hypothetical protein [Gossypium raimondii]
MGLTCNALYVLGPPELVVIAGAAAFVFGPKTLPEIRSIGKNVMSCSLNHGLSIVLEKDAGIFGEK